MVESMGMSEGSAHSTACLLSSLILYFERSPMTGFYCSHREISQISQKVRLDKTRYFLLQ